MNTTLTPYLRLACLSLACAWLAAQTATASTNTFQLRSHSTMHGTSTGAGPHGWATSTYSWRHGLTNQSLQISCQGLAKDHLYHLMASWGTNGDLMHLSDFMPNHSGAILMYHRAGTPHHFAGTNYPDLTWGMVGARTNHMSWVVFPPANSNWCDAIHSAALATAARSMTDIGPMHDGHDGHDGDHSGDGADCMDGDHGWEACGWPAMTNWWPALTNAWPTTAGWCWDYTNLWNPAPGYDGVFTNWWCSSARSAHHSLPLPPSIKPVPVLNGLVVTDEHLQPVLTFDLATPQTFTYQTHCHLDNQGLLPAAKGTLQASATRRASHFSLSATGLAPSATYFLEINGANVTTCASDRHGRLQLRKLPAGVPSLRGISTIALHDHNHQPVLSATLPPN